MSLPALPIRTVTATRYVTALREGGSLPGLLEADDDGLYVVKFHGAGQGPRVLVAELVAGELGRALGLPVPELVLVDVDPALAPAEPDTEIQELLQRSPGLNLGLDFLPGALSFRPMTELDPALAADIVWFDGLITNVDRTVKNVNLLVWHRKLWLIDHGASLYIHFTWRNPAEHARRPFPRIADHVLLPYASSIAAADARLAPLVTRDRLEQIVEAVPDAWLQAGAGSMDLPGAQRQAYVDYLLSRLESPRSFVEDADRARHP
ncbi:MAG: HipA family kinase [Candidatus Limnocylindrales bacterium]